MSHQQLWICLLLALAVSSCAALRKSNSAPLPNNPVADAKAVITVGNARFTILTSHVIRLEWSGSGNFEDRASFAIVNRLLPVPPYKFDNSSNAVVITTQFLTLVYTNKGGSPMFTPDNLAITLNGGDGIKTVWYPNSTKDGNLLGTFRTLDGNAGWTDLNCDHRNDNDNTHCTLGLVSTAGWTVVDESVRPVFDNDPVWPWFGTHAATVDWYFLGHGLNFEQALSDYTQIGGKIPLPPRFAFGIWWSRYWAFSDIEFMSIVDQYVEHQVPLDVLVIDMDWHETFYKEASQGQRDQAGQEPGWTGYTWDKYLFPNPDAFLDWVKTKNLKATVNIHPASGVQPHEALYPEMAIASGIDPSTNKYVPFDIVNKTNAKIYYDIMLQPLVKQGIDFFWLDWQQGEDWLNVKGMNPTFWLNYFFFTNPDRWGKEEELSKLRPLLFHRWGGLGNHRYQIGFTGDVVPLWSSLQFQPYFTATAANVGYAFWSHDIGGHTQPSPPELFTRWVQWGCFAPILRTHCTKDPLNDRRIWAYPLVNFFIMRDAMTLRASLVPYIYTSARIAHDTGVATNRGLYYSWPTYREAYNFTGQYIFGDDMVVSPVTAPGNADGITEVNVWIPPGEWIEWFSGLAFTGPKVVTRQFALDDIPVYVRAGAIIPILKPTDRAALIGATQDLPTTLSFVVFVSASVKTGSTNVYEDDGATDYYQDSTNTVWTTVTYNMTEASDKVVVSILPVTGTFPGFPSQRTYRVTLNGVFEPSAVTLDGTAITTWTYIGNSLALEVTTGPIDVTKGCTVIVNFAHPLTEPALLAGIPLAIRRMSTVKGLIDNQWAKEFQEDYEHVILAASTGQRMAFNPSSIYSEITGFDNLFTTGLNEVLNLTNLGAPVLSQITNLLKSAVPEL